MEAYKNELLDEWVGKIVLFKRLSAPELDEDLANRIVENPKSIVSQNLRSYTHAGVLKSYDYLGVVVQIIEDDPGSVFVPWGAIVELSHLTDEWLPRA